MPDAITVPAHAFVPAVRAFLDAPDRFAVAATANPDGAPRQAVLWYLVSDDGLHINSREGRLWPAALRRDPRVALTIADRYDYVVVYGRAEVVAGGQEALDEIRAMARRYGEDERQFDGQQRVSFLVRPDRVVVHGEIGA